MKADMEVLYGKKTMTVTDWIIFPDGSRRLYETVKTPLFQHGKVSGLLGISRDITGHKEAELMSNQASRAKSDFLAKMSHEIRTPMNAIIGMTELALRENELLEAHKHIMTVKQAGAHLLTIINDILDFSKIETGKLEIHSEQYSFSSLVNDVISIIRMRVMDSNLRFAVNIDSHIPGELIGDETRIRQILLNILNNAVKYTEKGYVSFTVGGEIINGDTINLTMEIMDSGRGIKEEDIEKLFGEYVQIDLDNNRGIEGIGLGLAITWNIVKAMGGDINVYSEYGKGSIFTITLPQKFSSPEAMASVHQAEEKSVLVYERREIFANSIVNSIDNLGVKCTLASSNEELLENMSAGTFPFIFISYGLLEKNRDIITKFGGNSKIVLLTEFGEAIPDKTLNILAMPVYSITIANILNGISDSFNYGSSEESIVRFSAPDASVLVVDDIKTNLKVAEGLMLPYKMRVDLCTNGVDAIEAVKANRYDLIFMDHKMPGMDGVETTFNIRDLEGEYFKTVPIIALTANAISDIREYFMQNGFNEFISKPIDTVKLNSILGKFIPKEKQKSLVNKYSNNQTEESDKIEIPGVNVNRGIFLSGGSRKMYLETLDIYSRDGLEKITEIRSALENGNIQLYTVLVHGLKSASINIGAQELGEKALALEMAGEEKDTDFIKNNNEDLLWDLEFLCKKIIAELVIIKEKQKSEENNGNMELLKAELEELISAIKTLNAEKINTTIDKMPEFAGSGETGDLIQNISDKILFGDFEEASKIAKTLLAEISSGTI